MVLGGLWAVLPSWDGLGQSLGGLGLPLLPQRPRNRLPWIPPICFFRFLTSLNFTSYCFSFFAPSWLALGLLLGPFSAPKLAQVRPKSALDTLLFQNVDFHETIEKTLRKTHLFDPRWIPISAQDGPMTAPRRSSKASFFVFIFVFVFRSFWFPF